MVTSKLAVLLLALVCCTFSAATTPCNPEPPVPKTPRPYYPPKTAPPNPFCPWDTLKLGACFDFLGDVGLLVGAAPSRGKCCALLEGLTNAEAALCLCTTIKESVLGVTTKWTVALSIVVSSCKKQIPDGFKCV
ncbi:hypothetical protein OPV22_021155 [Ensete ventricosum]|uniref:Bifunctional inhibitor/plant lipid transfer protein/seed storage helical domain-containing protein n=1 Tax=Ensete ventricosum TaxID=4639 RepID=A0AAV8QLT0_ENSVE|nr:hypothetical protein OPV22_021155 [Ensete ventricosum]